jgi:dCTP deaminase
VFSVLSDKTIQRYVAWGKIGLEPFDPSRVQPASIDLILGAHFKRWCVFPGSDRSTCIDLEKVDTQGMLAEVNLDPGQSLTLFPGDFCLATTEEYIRVPDDLVARVEGKSSLGRLGLTCHATAGFIDPGFEGRITLELYNMNPNPIVLRPGRAICQLSFMTLTEPAERPYGHPDLGSKYQGQKTTQESLYDG